MNKKQYSLIIGILVLLALLITNPKEEEHRAAVKTKINAFMQKQLNQQKDSGLAAGLGATFGTYLVNQLIDTGVSRDNYGVFSLTRFTFEKEDKVIGVGLLGNVFLSGKIDEAIENKGMGGIIKQ